MAKRRTKSLQDINKQLERIQKAEREFNHNRYAPLFGSSPKNILANSPQGISAIGDTNRTSRTALATRIAKQYATNIQRKRGVSQEQANNLRNSTDNHLNLYKAGSNIASLTGGKYMDEMKKQYSQNYYSSAKGASVG